MKGNKFFILIVMLLWIMINILPGYSAENYRRITITASLIVFDPEGTQETIVAWLTENRGYFLIKSDTLLTARVQVEKVRDFTHLLEALGVDIEKISETSEDIREELITLSSGIKSREEILEKNLKLFNRADVEDTLGIEQELVLLLNEIEGLKGRLNKLNVDRKYAYIEISFTFKKSALPQNVPSSFAWINTLDLYQFKQEGFSNEN
ncbi:MAG: DUF4349 domain-containing protein [Spirochaetales bacterium]|nr:DUF4349 domain-containing protein [Spirochaetales bacterium]